MSENRKARMARGMSKNIEGFRKYSYRIHEDIVVSGIDELKNQGDRVFMLTSTHRSHQDYLLLSSILDEHQIHGLRFAAGDNLTKLPILGKRFTQMGAFSVYRGKASQRSYLFKLVDQVKKMIEKGDLITVFPEGGRSYTGHMLELKGGVLGAPIVLQQENPEKEVCYLPISISYENPTEVPRFKSLLAGRVMRDEGKNVFVRTWGELQYYASDLLVFLKRGILNRFGKKFGKVFVDFGTPVPIRSLTDVEGNYREKAKNSFLANSKSIKECADKMRPLLISMYRLFPMHLVAYLLEKDNNMPVDTMASEIDNLVIRLKEANASFAHISDGKELFDIGIKELFDNGVLKGNSKQFTVKRPDLLTYHGAIIKDNLGEN